MTLALYAGLGFLVLIGVVDLSIYLVVTKKHG